jgi:hypothetical protein
MQQSFWHPVTLPNKQPGIQIHIEIEVSNMTAGTLRLMTGEIAGLLPFQQAIIGVQDPNTGIWGQHTPVPAGQLVKASLDVFAYGQPYALGQPFNAEVILTDHVRGRHRVRITVGASRQE